MKFEDLTPLLSGTTPAVIQRRGRHGNAAREAAMLLCRELFDVPASHLAVTFDVSPSGLSMTVQRARQRLESDVEFAATMLRIRENLGR